MRWWNLSQHVVKRADCRYKQSDVAEYNANRVVRDASHCVNDDLIETGHLSDCCEHAPNGFGGHDNDQCLSHPH